MRFASVAQLVEQGTENPRVVGSIPIGGTICGFSSFGRARPCQGRGGGFDPRNPLQTRVRIQFVPVIIRRRSQAVRQRSAKPLFPGPIPGGASMYRPLKRYLRQKARFYKEFRAFFMPQKVSKQKDIFSRFRPTARNRTGGTLF